MKHLYYIEEEDFCGKWFAEIGIEFEVGYCQGHAEDVDITDVFVRRLESNAGVHVANEWGRDDLSPYWLDLLDREAWRFVLRYVDDSELLEFVETYA